MRSCLIISPIALEFLILSSLNVKQNHIRLIMCPGKDGYITIFEKLASVCPSTMHEN